MATAPTSGSRSRPNYMYAVISLALVLFLVGFFGLLMLHGSQLVRTFKERVNILVEMTENHTPAQVDTLRQLLEVAPYVKEGSIRYVDRERAAELMQDDFGEDFMKLDLPNPFYDMFSFNVDAAQMQADSLTQIRRELRSFSFVSDVFYQESLIDEVAGNLKTLGWVALGIGLFFVVVAVTLIHNTVRLALYSNRFLIKNMQLVGASWGFISRPYLWRALGHGFIGSVLAVLGLGGLLIWLRSLIPELGLLQGGVTFLYLFGALMLLGMLIYLLSTYRVVNKYLRMRVDDLYT